jgi:transposase-like protein
MFKWRQTAPELIIGAVRWYLRYSLSLREVEELLAERGLQADHTMISACGCDHSTFGKSVSQISRTSWVRVGPSV